ncbi:TRI39 ligase, partial [Ramphastos sulfuratus]|nr:TRI39 ligase [Ramphastos sulfuratus]
QLSLDPSTAPPQLLVSEDRRRLSWAEAPEASTAPQGLEAAPCVLSSESFTSGSCCWEVEVNPKGSWALGVALEKEKEEEEEEEKKEGDEEDEEEEEEEEVWSLGLCQGQLWALTSLQQLPLGQVEVPRRVRVALDCQQGLVAFFNAHSTASILSLPTASCQGGRFRP